jgi:hypothetical protein
MRIVPGKVNPSLIDTIEYIIASGKITRQEHLQLSSNLLSAHKINEQERVQVSRILDYLKSGHLKFLD